MKGKERDRRGCALSIQYCLQQQQRLTLQYTKGGGLGRLFDDNDDGPRGADDDDDGKNCEEGGSKV